TYWRTPTHALPTLPSARAGHGPTPKPGRLWRQRGCTFAVCCLLTRARLAGIAIGAGKSGHTGSRVYPSARDSRLTHVLCAKGLGPRAWAGGAEHAKPVVSIPSR